MFEQICGLFGLIDDVISAIDAVAGFFEDALGEITGFFGDVGDFMSDPIGGLGDLIGFRHLSENADPTCSEDHYTVCHVPDGQTTDSCAACLLDVDATCTGCG